MTEPIKLILELNPLDGSVNISGPIHDKILCYGLLELGKDIIRNYKPNDSGLIIPHLTLKKGGQN